MFFREQDPEVYSPSDQTPSRRWSFQIINLGNLSATTTGAFADDSKADVVLGPRSCGRLGVSPNWRTKMRMR